MAMKKNKKKKIDDSIKEREGYIDDDGTLVIEGSPIEDWE